MKQRVLTRKRAGLKKATLGLKSTTVAAYSGVFLLIMTIVAIGYQPTQQAGSLANIAETTVKNNAATPVDETSVDQLVATNVAAGIAERAGLPVAASLANQSVSLAIQNQLAQNDADTISKPQILELSAGQRGMRHYTAKAGDTAESVGKKFGISATTVKWANDLTSDAINKGEKLLIPPIDGVVYTAKSGDSIESIAKTYKANQDRIIAYNDLEISGLTKGKQIMLPGGVMPESQRPGYVAPAQPGPVHGGGDYSIASNQLLNASAGNRYAYGNCTWYAFERRAEMGRPIGSFWGHAATWSASARAAGYSVSNTPRAGAIAHWYGGVGGSSWSYGHVAIVEKVNSDGSITISEMNYAGNFNRVTNRTIDPAGVSSFIY